MRPQPLLLSVCLALALAISACGRSSPDPATAGPNESEVTATTAVLDTPPPAKQATSPASTAAVAGAALPVANYLDLAIARADQTLQATQAQCEAQSPEQQDDCIASATSHRDAEIAAARIEYEAQLAREHAE